MHARTMSHVDCRTCGRELRSFSFGGRRLPGRARTHLQLLRCQQPPSRRRSAERVEDPTWGRVGAVILFAVHIPTTIAASDDDCAAATSLGDGPFDIARPPRTEDADMRIARVVGPRESERATRRLSSASPERTKSWSPAFTTSRADNA